MTAPTEFNARQLAVLAEARALGGWEVDSSGRVRRPSSPAGCNTHCPLMEVAWAKRFRDAMVVSVVSVALGLTVAEGWLIADAADLPTAPRRPALLRELGMEAP
jgi:hypothetical protein